jgi:predicted O-methyltransferase YrrM
MPQLKIAGITLIFTSPPTPLLRMRRPSVLRHYYINSFRQSLTGVGAHEAEVRAEFETRTADGQFEDRWFDPNIAPWCDTLSKTFDRTDPLRILEVGSWEGRSTLFLLTYFPQGHLTAVDTWAGSEEQSHIPHDLEDRFDKNLSPFAGRLTKHKGASRIVLPQLLDEHQEFDLIYIDGSHFADDVLTDGINSWRLLRPGGVLIFDDLTWDQYPRVRDNPAWAIDLFLKYHAGEYKILNVTSQLALQKVKHPD